MCKLPTIKGLVECAQHHNVWMHILCFLCGSGPEAAQPLKECPVQAHDWRLAWKSMHSWLNTSVRPRASQVQGQPKDPFVLEQCAVSIATLSLRTAHLELAGPHEIGTEFMRLVVTETHKVWLSHAKARQGLIKAQAR